MDIYIIKCLQCPSTLLWVSFFLIVPKIYIYIYNFNHIKFLFILCGCDDIKQMGVFVHIAIKCDNETFFFF